MAGKVDDLLRSIVLLPVDIICTFGRLTLAAATGRLPAAARRIHDDGVAQRAGTTDPHLLLFIGLFVLAAYRADDGGIQFQIYRQMFRALTVTGEWGPVVRAIVATSLMVAVVDLTIRTSLYVRLQESVEEMAARRAMAAAIMSLSPIVWVVSMVVVDAVEIRMQGMCGPSFSIVPPGGGGEGWRMMACLPLSTMSFFAVLLVQSYIWYAAFGTPDGKRRVFRRPWQEVLASNGFLPSAIVFFAATMIAFRLMTILAG